MQNHRHNRPGQQQQTTIQLPAMPIMIKGLKAEYHAKRQVEKQALHQFDGGFDLYPTTGEHKFDKVSTNWGIFRVSTMLHAVIGPGHIGWVTSRSSSLMKLGGGEIMCGKIDAHYTGEWYIVVRCLLSEQQDVAKAIESCAAQEVAIAQCFVVPAVIPLFARWDDNMARTFTRGVQGFGSTDMPKPPSTNGN
jgi:dUTPase